MKIFDLDFLISFTLLFLFSCSQPDITNVKSNTFKVELTKNVIDTAPFCKFMVVATSTNETLPDPKILDFKPIEIRKISMEDLYTHHLYSIPLNKIKSNKNEISVLYGINKYGEKIISFDANNDGSFINEKTYKVNGYIPFIKITNVECFVGNKYEKETVFVQPTINSLGVSINNSDKIKTGLNYMVMPNFLTGTHEINNALYNLALFNYSTEQIYTSQIARLIIVPITARFLPCTSGQIQYKVGDTIYLNNNIYLFDSVNFSGNELFFQDLGIQKKEYGLNINNYCFPISSTDILTGNKFSTTDLNKYLLLDFWGTWCGPCKESTNDLKELNRLLKDKPFELVGVAFDKSKDDVTDYLKKENINWTNIFDQQSSSSVCDKFKIQAYPTFILVDPNGKIIMRTSGKESLPLIKKQLLEKL